MVTIDASTFAYTETVVSVEHMTQGDMIEAVRLSCEASALRAMLAHGRRRLPRSIANKRLAMIRAELRTLEMRYA